MKPPQFSTSHYLLFIFIFILFTSSYGQENQQYLECYESFFGCGQVIQGITYPFWGGSRPSHCGLEKFHLTCNNNGYTTIDIDAQIFRVLHIYQFNRTMRIARNDLSDDVCPPPFTSTTLNHTFFAYRPDYQNLTLFYDCDNDIDPRLPNTIINCSINGVDRRGFYAEEPFSSSDIPNVERCNMNMTVPVLSEGIEEFRDNNSMQLRDLVNWGFDVQYIIDNTDCLACQTSGARCWINTTISPEEATCVCPDGIGPLICTPPPSAGLNFTSCVLQNCGNGPNISYPFWIPQNQESYCGSLGFNITCKNNNPVITISEDDYILKDIFYSNNSFLLADADVNDKNHTCPTPRNNFSIDGTPFSYGPAYANLYFLYDCSYPHPRATYQVSCASNTTYHSFAVFHTEVLREWNYSADSCQGLVNAPVDGESIENLLQMNYTDVLRRGFVLEWSGVNCSNCDRSGGRCGSLNNEFICFCDNQPHLGTCDAVNRRDVKLKLGIGNMPLTSSAPLLSLVKNYAAHLVSSLSGFGAAGFSILVMGIIFFLYHRRNKKRYGSSSFMSRNISSHPASISDLEKAGTYLGVHIFSYNELEQATNKFDSKRELGDGGFGTVYKVDITRHRHEINLSNMAVNKILNHTLHELVDPSLGFETDYKVRKMVKAVAELAFQCLQNAREIRPSMEQVLEELKGIQSNDYNIEKEEDVDVPKDDVGLLKKNPQTLSPDTVSVKWVSISSTSSSSIN
ncbi:hypothetical protein LguiA_027893 [Lonicera macranthoides]